MYEEPFNGDVYSLSLQAKSQPSNRFACRLYQAPAVFTTNLPFRILATMPTRTTESTETNICDQNNRYKLSDETDDTDHFDKFRLFRRKRQIATFATKSNFCDKYELLQMSG